MNKTEKLKYLLAPSSHNILLPLVIYFLQFMLPTYSNEMHPIIYKCDEGETNWEKF